ncbi:hypothetical protein WA026_013905 [Henosepilachna vigintioctopunctata]|uniref:Nicotinamide riboside kinase 1 n=1 Tax=Henosepilachna vigintioctopunctata TaxID=420089 RepID=A0AAW1U7A0_9CUCU
MEVIVIAISGVTCGGKTTLANELKKLIPSSIILSQDDYCYDLKDSRHIWCEEVNHINFDVITSLDMERMLEDLKKTVGNRKLLKVDQSYTKLNHQDVSNEFMKNSIAERLQTKGVNLIILDGFLLFAYRPLLPLINLKYFFTLDRNECFKRRIQKVYEPPDVPGYFDKCVWPEYLKHLEEVQTDIGDVTYLDNSVERPLDVVIENIYRLIM